MKTRLTKKTEGLKLVADCTDGNPTSEFDTMIHIGQAAWRVLQNARKAAIARNEKGADAERRGDSAEELHQSFFGLATRQHDASATAGERAELERARKKRPAGS